LIFQIKLATGTATEAAMFPVDIKKFDAASTQILLLDF
jgi:hypothetical protein